MRTSLVILLVVVILNVWATLRLSRSGLPSRVRGLHTIMVWLVPLIGAGFALRDTAAPRQESPSDPTPNRDEPPRSLEVAGMPVFPVVEHLLDGQGFPILDWQALERWSASAAAPEQSIAATELGRRALLLHLRDSLGDHTHLLETNDTWVLSSYRPKLARAAARYVATTRQRIASLLDGLANFPADSRSILLVFDDQEQYYRYITNYYPDEGEFAFSSGLFVDPGCPHFVTMLDDLAIIEPVIAHEMTHASLAYLSLPKWLDEGIAVTTEHQVSTSHRHPSEALELMEKHRGFWNVERMQEFWSGASFVRTDDGNALSYDLARHIVALIGREWASFTRFVRGAQRTDAGAAAANAELNLDLGHLAAAAIGIPAQAGWSPDPASWPSPEETARAKR